MECALAVVIGPSAVDLTMRDVERVLDGNPRVKVGARTVKHLRG
jgi:hypothetical protein